MIGVILITHGRIGAELIAAVEGMLGPQPRMEALAVEPRVPLERMGDELRAAVTRVDGDGDGVLVLADMFGGTPCNLAAGAAGSNAVEVVTGVNLPMLVTVARARLRSGLTHTAQAGMEAGRHFIGMAKPAPDGSPRAAAYAGEP